MILERSNSDMKVVFGDFSSFINSNVCLYSHFDYENSVDEYVFLALEEFNKCGYKIVFISTCIKLSELEIEKLSKICHSVILRDNVGLDFGGWANVLNTYPGILNADNLTLVNDSIYGPFSDLALFIEGMNKKGYDFWGVTESYQIKPHIQSFYINYTKKILQSELFRSFWQSYKNLDNKQKIIESYEITLTGTLKEAGFTYGTGFGRSNCLESIPGITIINPTHHLWYEIIDKYKVPFVKVELLRDNPFDIDLSLVQKTISDSGYDYNIIFSHIDRVRKYYTKAIVSASANQAIKKASIKSKLYMKSSNTKQNRFDLDLSNSERKLSIILHAFKMIFLKPVSFLQILKRSIITALKCFKKDVVSSYQGIRLGGDLINTLYEYRNIRLQKLKTAYSEADCFPMRQVKVNNKYAVVCHVYYVEVYAELLEAIKRVPSADVYISLVEGKSESLLDIIKNDFPDSYIHVFKNHGRDVYPFLKFIQSGVLYKYDAVLKIHSKQSKNDRSSYDFDGESWRKNVLNELVPISGIDAILEKFVASKKVGVICHNDYIYDDEHMGSNEVYLKMLCNSLGLDFNRDEFEFPAGTMFWIKPWLLRHLDALELTANDFDPEPLALDGTMAHALERFIGVVAIKAGYSISSMNKVIFNETKNNSKVDVLAFYLPQYHSIKENDAWWGKGFTEWRNVGKARPMFKTHYQPRIPEELGYYDLKMSEVQERQAEMANEHGLAAFAFYQYWFSGKKLLSSPIDDFMNNENIDLKFLVCWANENWTRSWDGLNKDILLEQQYENGWEEEYVRDVLPYFQSAKYYTRNGRPVLLIYNVSAIPNCKSSMYKMREVFRELGVGEIEIIAVWFYGVVNDSEIYGVDGFSEFPPHRLNFIGVRNNILPELDDDFQGNVYSYESVANARVEQIKSGKTTDISLGVMCGWDNTARRQFKSDVFHGSTPATFRKWLDTAYQHSLDKSTSNNKQMLFINAWNEWAEGTYLEPDMRYGAGYLEAVKSVIK